jgi:class 3 adenylate cyclase/tetratricopeptide (TPR) repeat protein
MRCAACENENPDGSRFCLKCGAALGVACPTCAADLPAGAWFCNQCGGAVDANAIAAVPAAAPQRDPRDYTPKHLANKILKQKSAIEGERKQVTVLFADVKSSLDMQEDLDAERWHGIMDRFFKILADGVHRFEGTINQYTGDGIMALFGAPIGHEDHAQRACYTALHLTEALREYTRELRREFGLDFSTRMGINSGEVVVGKIGDDLRMDYTAQGQTVGLASRMEGLAEPGKTCLTAETAERVKGYFELEDLGEFNVKGVSDPVPVFELAGVGTARTRFDVSRARGLTRFVGRDSYMDALETALAAARQGKGRAVGIVADAGVGKSRLCFEFTERCRSRGINVIQASGVAHGKNIPLLPILEIFRAYFGIDDRDNPRRAREKTAGRLLLIDDSFRDVLPLIFDFLGVPDPELRSPAMDAEARQRRIVAVLRRLFERGNPNGFVLMVEDLHWLDPASEDFIAAYVDAIPSSPGLLLLNFRPEFRADWMQKTWYQQLPLDPLGPDAIRDLLHDLLGDDSSVRGLAESIHERTQGNPYFTEEIVRSLAEAGTLEGTRGHYRLVSPIASLEVPYSIHAVLSARIDRLAEREKRLLQKAAVIGLEFSEPILEAVADVPRSELAESLALLCNAEFIHQLSLFPISEYAFAHPLTQEVALDSQLHEHRRQTHAAVAIALREFAPERLDENAALLAHHYEEADLGLEAARSHARAAAWSGMKDLDGTLRHWQRVRDLARAEPVGAETNELRLTACAEIIGKAGFRLGLSEVAVEELYQEGRELSETTGNQRLLLNLRGAYGSRLVSLGRIRQALDLSAENVRDADELGEPDLMAQARLGDSYAHLVTGNYARVLEICEEGTALTDGNLEMGRELVGFSLLVWFEMLQASVIAEQGRLHEAILLTEGVFRLAREAGVSENLGWLSGSVVELAELTGQIVFEELGDPRTAALEALRIAEEMGSPFSQAIASRVLGATKLLTGQPKEALEAFQYSLDLLRSSQTGFEQEATVLANLSSAHLELGDAREARRMAEEAIELAVGRGQRHSEMLGQIALASSLSAADGRETRRGAEAALDRASTLIEETGAQVYVPQIEEVRGRLARARGDADACVSHLREAQRIYAEIGADGHVQRLSDEFEAD